VELTQPVDKDEVLTRDTDEPRGVGRWPAGTEGTIVIDFGEHKLVEIYDENGIALDFLTVPATRLELVAEHSGGGPKARRLEQLLGITKEAAGYLEGQIEARLLDTPAIAVRENPPHGVNCAVDVPVRGIGAKADRVLTVRTIWIYQTPDAPPRLVSAYTTSSDQENRMHQAHQMRRPVRPPS
jgi:hypothetical protein